jgi:hypothetical protein
MRFNRERKFLVQIVRLNFRFMPVLSILLSLVALIKMLGFRN